MDYNKISAREEDGAPSAFKNMCVLDILGIRTLEDRKKWLNQRTFETSIIGPFDGRHEFNTTCHEQGRRVVYYNFVRGGTTQLFVTSLGSSWVLGHDLGVILTKFNCLNLPSEKMQIEDEVDGT